MQAGTRVQGEGRERVLLITVVAVIAVVLIARFAPRQREVVLLGDSITYQSADTFDRRLGTRWRVTTSGIPGYRADQRLPDVAELSGREPDQVIINLGTNDVMQRTSADETISALDQLGSGFPSARCVHLVTVNPHIFGDGELPVRVGELNERIRELAARRGWDVVAWDELVNEYDGSGQPDGPLTSDSIHPTDLGERKLADAYAEALEHC